MIYPPLRQLKSDLSRLELIPMMAVAASNPSAAPSFTSKPHKQASQAGLARSICKPRANCLKPKEIRKNQKLSVLTCSIA
jgi:hypothetical protein